MKIEKINNNKIRCYLDRDDLSARQIDLSELAYGTEKARLLFHEMLEEASEEFGFDFEGSPIMVEAIPMADSIVLIISKVDDPEELDTRFSRFAPASDDNEAYDELSSLIPQLLEGLENDTDIIEEDTNEQSESVNDEKDFTRIFLFKSLDDISNVAKVLSFSEDIQSAVYYNSSESSYYLVTSIGDLPKENYIKACNTLSEFGKRVRGDSATAAYYEEHLECIIKEHAIEICKNL